MDVQALKNKIISGEISNDELLELIGAKSTSVHPRKQSGGFFKTAMKGFIDAYTKPNLWRLAIESFLILLVIIGVITLSLAGRLDAMITSVMLAFVLGYLFGKIR